MANDDGWGIFNDGVIYDSVEKLVQRIVLLELSVEHIRSQNFGGTEIAFDCVELIFYVDVQSPAEPLSTGHTNASMLTASQTTVGEDRGTRRNQTQTSTGPGLSLAVIVAISASVVCAVFLCGLAVLAYVFVVVRRPRRSTRPGIDTSQSREVDDRQTASELKLDYVEGDIEEF